MVGGAVKIQSSFRGKAARKEADRRLAEKVEWERQRAAAATKIQALQRGISARVARFESLQEKRRDSATKIQALQRGRIARAKRMQELKLVYSTAKRASDEAEEQVSKGKQQASELSAIDLEALRRVQALSRGRAVRNSAEYRGRLEELKEVRRSASAAKIQALQRGRMARKHARQLKVFETEALKSIQTEEMAESEAMTKVEDLKDTLDRANKDLFDLVHEKGELLAEVEHDIAALKAAKVDHASEKEVHVLEKSLEEANQDLGKVNEALLNVELEGSLDTVQQNPEDSSDKKMRENRKARRKFEGLPTELQEATKAAHRERWDAMSWRRRLKLSKRVAKSIFEPDAQKLAEGSVAEGSVAGESVAEGSVAGESAAEGSVAGESVAGGSIAGDDRDSSRAMVRVQRMPPSVLEQASRESGPAWGGFSWRRKYKVCRRIKKARATAEKTPQSRAGAEDTAAEEAGRGESPEASSPPDPGKRGSSRRLANPVAPAGDAAVESRGAASEDPENQKAFSKLMKLGENTVQAATARFGERWVSWSWRRRLKMTKRWLASGEAPANPGDGGRDRRSGGLTKQRRRLPPPVPL
jgi:hypothetical protein